MATAEELEAIFEAGRRAAADAPPLSREQIDLLADMGCPFPTVEAHEWVQPRQVAS